MQAVNKFLFYGIALLGTVALALQAINFSVWNRFWPFFALIFMHLSAERKTIYRILIFTGFFVLGLFWLTYLAWYDPITHH